VHGGVNMLVTEEHLPIPHLVSSCCIIVLRSKMDIKHLQALRKQLLEIGSRYQITGIYVFGSVARGESTSSSDVDFLIEMQEGASMLGVGGFIHDASELLEVEVDAIPMAVLAKMEDRKFKTQVQSEAVPL
jgi:predicted nucleotidyltransferase